MLAATLHKGALVRIGVGVLGVRVEELLADLAGSDGSGVLAVQDVDWRGAGSGGIPSEDQFIVLVFFSESEEDSPCSSERPLVSGITK